MEIWQAIVLGLVQGLTEFLPVSSSGHLAFLQSIFGLNLGELELFFDIMLHLGTLVAVCVVFWKEIILLFKKPYKTLLFLILATIPAAIGGLFLDDLIESAVYGGGYRGIFLAFGFLLTAGLLLTTEVVAKRNKKTYPICLHVALPMGFSQLIALLPGISRSGSTIAAGTFAGGDREEVARFSFLMSVPVILGSFAVSLVKGFMDGEIQHAFQIGGATFGWCLAVGFVVAALSGLLAIRVMLKAIKNANYKWFSVYLALLAVATLVLFGFGFLQ